MRKLLLSLVAVLSLAWPMSAQAADEAPGVTTTGTATVYAVPDKAVFSVSISAVDPDVTKACAQSEADGAKLVKAIKEAGIAPEDIATDTISISVHYKEGTEYRNPVRDGYLASRRYTVTLRDLTQIEKLFSAMVNAGVNATPSVNLAVSNLRPSMDQARAMAIKAAKEKAVALAQDLDCTVGKARTITEGSQSSSYFRYDNRASNSSNEYIGSAQLTPDTPDSAPIGRIPVQASVTVTFELK